MLEVEEAVVMGFNTLCSAAALSISFSVPLVEVRDKGAMLLSHVPLPGTAPTHQGQRQIFVMLQQMQHGCSIDPGEGG